MLNHEEICVVIGLINEKIKDLSFCITAGGDDECGTINSRLLAISKIKEKLTEFKKEEKCLN